MNPPESSGSANQRFRMCDVPIPHAFRLVSEKIEGFTTKVESGMRKYFCGSYIFGSAAHPIWMNDAEGSFKILALKEIGRTP